MGGLRRSSLSSLAQQRSPSVNTGDGGYSSEKRCEASSRREPRPPPQWERWGWGVRGAAAGYCLQLAWWVMWAAGLQRAGCSKLKGDVIPYFN